MADSIDKKEPYTLFFGTFNRPYSILVNTILESAFILGYDIESAMLEKLKYNKTRADHKRENRQKEGGKKF